MSLLTGAITASGEERDRSLDALCRGLLRSGVDVTDIGMVGTEEVYYATFSLNLDGGVMVTASHNPAKYNGIKLCRSLARAVGEDTGLAEVRTLAKK